MMSRKTVSVLPALQRMVLDVKMLGFPVTRIHGDRAGELRAKQVFWGMGSFSPSSKVMHQLPMLLQKLE